MKTKMYTNKNNAAITYMFQGEAGYSGTEKRNDQKIELSLNVYIAGIAVAHIVPTLWRDKNIAGSVKRWIIKPGNLLMDVMPDDSLLDEILAEAELAPDELSLNGAEPFDPTPIEPAGIM